MGRLRSIAGLAIAFAAFATTAHAPPPPPPPPPAPGEPAHCENPGVRIAPSPEAVQVVRLPAARLAALAPKGSDLRVAWGLRITVKDPVARARIGSIVAMDFGGLYGLLAVTTGHAWLAVDVRDWALDQMSAVGVAPLRDAPGEPLSLSYTSDYRAEVDFPGQDRPSVYDLDACGMAAGPVRSWRDREVRDWSLPGYHRRAMSDPDRLMGDLRMGVNDFWVLWRPDTGRDHTLVQLRHTTGYPRPAELEIARLPPMSAIASLWDDRAKVVRLWMAGETGKPGVFDIYGFTYAPAAPPAATRAYDQGPRP